MASIVTDSFRIKNAADLIESIGEDSLYLFIGKSTPWTLRSSTDTTPPTPIDTVSETQRQHWADMLGAKRIGTSDAVHMVRRINFTVGTRYDIYDAADPDLFRKNFYVMTAAYNVYKVLARPASGGVTTEPTTTAAATQTLDGGWVYKYMYTLSTSDVLKFLTPQHIPVRSLTPGVGGPAASNTVTFGDASLNPVSRDGVVGHGYDAIRELGAYFVGVNTRFEFSEGNLIPVDNEYRKIGLVYNPNASAGGIATAAVVRQTTLLTLSSAPSNSFQPDETITAPGGKSAIVVEHSSTDRTKLYVIVTSTTNFAAGDSITGGTSAVTATIATGGVSGPQLATNTGDMIFVEYRRPIPRSNDQVESLSVILEF